MFIPDQKILIQNILNLKYSNLNQNLNRIMRVKLQPAIIL